MNQIERAIATYRTTLVKYQNASGTEVLALADKWLPQRASYLARIIDNPDKYTQAVAFFEALSDSVPYARERKAIEYMYEETELPLAADRD